MRQITPWLLTATPLLLTLGCSQNPRIIEAQGTRLVNLAEADPTLIIDARYATTNNFVGLRMYPRNEIWLERGTATKLMKAQADLRSLGLGLKVFDGYRPLEVQRVLWEIMPDPRYVANPKNGSRHNRGCAVDVTLVDAEGDELAMPTKFDDFSERAHHDYMALPQEVLANRKRLRNAMINAGFKGLKTEWWHYDSRGWEDFPVLDINVWDEPLFPEGTDGAKKPAQLHTH
jgi:D-alanyl-D-alanine dipeptidase